MTLALTALAVETVTLALAALAVETMTLALATLAVETVPLTLATLLESGLNSLLLVVAELAVLVGVELVHELSLEVLLNGLLLVVAELAVFVGIELSHELGFTGFHESLAILLGSGSCLGSGGYNNLGGSRNRSLLSENRQSGYEGDDDGLLHNFFYVLRFACAFVGDLQG